MENRGFTFIELIVVVAIMGVAMSIGVYSLSVISLANAKSCASELELALERTRTQSLSSDSDDTGLAAVCFYIGTDGVYMEKSYEGTAKKIGGKGVEITYQIKDSGTFTLDSQKLTFTFNRSSGAFREVSLDGISKGECTSITVSGGGNTYTITCYPKTGKTRMQ